MPRIRQNKKKYLIKDFPYYVKVKMKENGYKQEYMAKELGISQPTFSYKIRNNSFTFRDFVGILEILKPSDEEIVNLIKSWE